MARLELLKARLKAGDEITVAILAEEFNVSMRTLSRDIEVLREQGLPIDADRGRGGGIRLDRHWGVGRVNFSFIEAVDLLVSLAIAEQMNSPLFMVSLKGVRRKILASFSPNMRHSVAGLTSRILVGSGASSNMLASYNLPNQRFVALLHEAFLLCKGLNIVYKAVDGNKTKRCVQPHYLLLVSPIWYILAWDELRQDVRSFRCDRICNLKISNGSFKLRPKADFEGTLMGINAIQSMP